LISRREIEMIARVEKTGTPTYGVSTVAGIRRGSGLGLMPERGPAATNCDGNFEPARAPLVAQLASIESGRQSFGCDESLQAIRRG